MSTASSSGTRRPSQTRAARSAVLRPRRPVSARSGARAGRDRAGAPVTRRPSRSMSPPRVSAQTARHGVPARCSGTMRAGSTTSPSWASSSIRHRLARRLFGGLGATAARGAARAPRRRCAAAAARDRRAAARSSTATRTPGAVGGRVPFPMLFYPADEIHSRLIARVAPRTWTIEVNAPAAGRGPWLPGRQGTGRPRYRSC